MKTTQLHAVDTLRCELKARATREFKARGSRMQRCSGCHLAEHACICALRPSLQAEPRFCLLMHALEPLKPTNTGRLIADCLADTQAFVWSRTEVNPALLALLADSAWQPYVVFPAEYASAEQTVVSAPQIEPGKRPLLIILDATWTQARKMFRKSPYLAGLPLLSLHPEQASRYRLRRSSREEHLCTVEVAAACLAVAGEHQAGQSLDDYFQVFSEGYLASRLKVPISESPARARLRAVRGADTAQ